MVAKGSTIHVYFVWLYCSQLGTGVLATSCLLYTDTVPLTHFHTMSYHGPGVSPSFYISRHSLLSKLHREVHKTTPPK